MRFKIHKKPIIISSLIIVLVATLGIALFYKDKKASATAINLVGRAQILNTNGYLNFTDYSANVTTSNIGCQFDGYGWSSDIGWVAFGTTDNPDGPVICNLTTGAVSGKAKVINDGSIIDFNSDLYHSNVRILSSGDFTGYAWSTALGWINFTGVSAPGISLVPPTAPQNVRIYDTSDRVLAEYSITLRWQVPTSFDAGAFDSYLVERGTDGVTFAQVASTSSLGYLDTTTSTGTTYYYRVKAKYTSGTLASSEIVLMNPTGKYTTPPNLDGTPTIKTNPSSVDFSWRTDREASSFVKITQGNTFVSEQGHSTFEKAHEVTVTGLKPGITYNYQLDWLDQDGNEGKSNIEEFKTSDAPYISEVNISNITLSSALITWKSTSVAQTNLYFGKDATYGSEESESSGSGTTNHSIALNKLETGTTYHFKIRGTDTDSNDLVSDDYSFSTLPLPLVSNVTTQPITDRPAQALKINWTTNVPTSSTITYVPASGKSSEVSKSEMQIAHELETGPLEDNATYTFTISGRDQFGNEATSTLSGINTKNDTRPPVISNFTVETEPGEQGDDSVKVIASWKTDESATSKVEFGVGAGDANLTQSSQESTVLDTSHVVVVSGVEPSQAYQFRAISKDASGNLAKSTSQILVTNQKAQSIFDLITKSLSKAFGWMGKLIR
ncbi:MAG: fibronectin type III domain-containing protein [Candidatus Berkelbacteria bacterium]|nr:fibronectin type III domain-containing protein [Candidatus Berkelbacteria bacterium]